MKTIILKNTTGSELYVLLRQIPATDQDDFSNESEEDLRNDNGLLTLISTGDIVVNDGTSDLDSEVGQSYISGGDLIRDEGSTITLNATALDFVGGGVVASNAGDGVITISIPGGAGVSNAITTVVGDTGSFTGVGEDTLNILGGTNVTTTIVGDTLTIDVTAGADQNLWETITSDSGSTVANITTDTLSIFGGLGIDTSITGDILSIVLNADLDDLNDVDASSPDGESHLVFDSGSGNWETQSPGQATAFGQMFEIVFSKISAVSGAWIDSNGTPSNQAPPVCGWKSRLVGLTYTNNRDGTNTTIEIYRTAEGASTSSRTLVATWVLTNARTARKTDYTSSGGGNFVEFFEGDKISVYFDGPSGPTAPRGITLILHFIVTDFTGAEVIDDWTGNITDP